MTDDAGTAGGASRYYRGRLRQLRRGSETGLVRSATGREIPFVFRFVETRGKLRHFADLRDGMAVGFDVGWTSSGLRVTVLYVDPEGGAADDAADDSDGQAGAEEEIAADDFADGGAEDGDIE